MNRRTYLKLSSFALAASSMFRENAFASPREKDRYSLCLGQWTYQRSFRGIDGYTKRSSVEFPTIAGELGFGGVDYSGILMGDDHLDSKYLAELNHRAQDAGVQNILILIDLSDALGAKDTATRAANVKKYQTWLNAAAELGCHGVRVNPISDDSLSPLEQCKLLADGLSQLVDVCQPLKLDVLVENHGEGLRCNGHWIASVVKRVQHERCGTLPDFGNFQKNRKTGEFYDRYQGVAAMLPFAKAICAKSHDFDDLGDECYANFDVMFQMIHDSGFHGWIEIEYEGPGGPSNPIRPAAGRLGERDGALATKRLVQKSIDRVKKM